MTGTVGRDVDPWEHFLDRLEAVGQADCGPERIGMAVVCPLGFIGSEVREHSDYVFIFSSNLFSSSLPSTVIQSSLTSRLIMLSQQCCRGAGSFKLVAKMS